ncbi:MAG TPA: HD domain-containing protein, partial [Candidatus Methylomirabilis sp.]|nr:HD domain-containing protein [Candidatus Methylomirabilis sp.]
MRSAEAFASIEGLPQEQADLLVTAAAFHDIGYLKQPLDHETASVCIAREVLPSFGFSKTEINQVVRMILATHLPQQPHDHLEELLADADLSILGMETFMDSNEALRAEQA